MTSPLAPYFPYIASFVFFSCYTVLYKNNPVYRFTTNLIIGVFAGYNISSMIDTWYRSVYLAMWDKQGNFLYTYLYVWVLGALYFFIFIPRLISVYRSCLNLHNDNRYGYYTTIWSSNHLGINSILRMGRFCRDRTISFCYLLCFST